ncbi:PREDICTED: uncharacterized protein LOC106812487 isoform X3 [Priapulus caudatus]|uniref:Uncharacterized protein LOC106812487 isoform X3 n=1 Tax=Priapulus caudatus TaxID=37621 RepID=A0ABM1EI41_PRICU|nr:PREDICTED: uncharacterized protein LOC106812487 isoform X3 [Priapulus caudatus]
MQQLEHRLELMLTKLDSPTANQAESPDTHSINDNNSQMKNKHDAEREMLHEKQLKMIEALKGQVNDLINENEDLQLVIARLRYTKHPGNSETILHQKPATDAATLDYTPSQQLEGKGRLKLKDLLVGVDVANQDEYLHDAIELQKSIAEELKVSEDTEYDADVEDEDDADDIDTTGTTEYDFSSDASEENEYDDGNDYDYGDDSNYGIEDDYRDIADDFEDDIEEVTGDTNIKNKAYSQHACQEKCMRLCENLLHLDTKASDQSHQLPLSIDNFNCSTCITYLMSPDVVGDILSSPKKMAIVTEMYVLNMSVSCGDKDLFELVWKRLSQLSYIDGTIFNDIWESVNRFWWQTNITEKMQDVSEAFRSAQDKVKQSFKDLQIQHNLENVAEVTKGVASTIHNHLLNTWDTAKTTGERIADVHLSDVKDKFNKALGYGKQHHTEEESTWLLRRGEDRDQQRASKSNWLITRGYAREARRNKESSND